MRALTCLQPITPVGPLSLVSFVGPDDPKPLFRLEPSSSPGRPGYPDSLHHFGQQRPLLRNVSVLPSRRHLWVSAQQRRSDSPFDAGSHRPRSRTGVSQTHALAHVRRPVPAHARPAAVDSAEQQPRQQVRRAPCRPLETVASQAGSGFQFRDDPLLFLQSDDPLACHDRLPRLRIQTGPHNACVPATIALLVPHCLRLGQQSGEGRGPEQLRQRSHLPQTASGGGDLMLIEQPGDLHERPPGEGFVRDRPRLRKYRLACRMRSPWISASARAHSDREAMASLSPGRLESRPSMTETSRPPIKSNASRRGPTSAVPLRLRRSSFHTISVRTTPEVTALLAASKPFLVTLLQPERPRSTCTWRTSSPCRAAQARQSASCRSMNFWDR